MAVAKKTAGADLWVVMRKGDDECYEIYKSEAKALAAAKEQAQEAADWNGSNKDIVFQMFKLDREVKFAVEVKEVPVMTKQRIAKVKE